MIYFDNSATTAMLPEVATTVMKVSEQFIGNPSSLHALGVQAQQLLQKAREQVAQVLAVQTDTIYFTSGATESNNWAIQGTAWAKKMFGNHIITSQVEHPSVYQTMHFLERQGFDITYLPVDKDGQVSLQDVKAAIRPDTILVSIMWVNNEVGSVQPIEEIANLLVDYPTIHFHVDAVQALMYVLEKGIPERVDLLSLSAHKFHGPRGIGVLYKKANRRLESLLHGGGQEHKERSGTENVAAIAGMAKALRLYKEHQDNQIRAYQQQLQQFFDKLDYIVVLSPQQNAPHIITIALPQVRGEVMVHALADKGIYISTTSACSSKQLGEHHTLAAMGIDKAVAQCAVRISLAQSTTQADVQQFMSVFEQVYQQFVTVFKKSK